MISVYLICVKQHKLNRFPASYQALFTQPMLFQDPGFRKIIADFTDAPSVPMASTSASPD
jgi:hypothetical protein